MHNREDRWEGQVQGVGKYRNLGYSVFDVFVYIKRRLERDLGDDLRLGITQEQNLAGRLSACHNA